jgi:hypothetical protein
MLCKDDKAGFQKSSIWPFSRYRFQAGGLEAAHSRGFAGFRRVLRIQRDEPVLVLLDETRGRAWWLFRGVCYYEDEGLSAVEVKALVQERESQRRRRLQRAVALMQQAEPVSEAPVRDVLPGALKRFVWQRDGGRCVACGARERLEFDHIIPVSLGGANSARNVQLLCQDCNRHKSGGPRLRDPAILKKNLLLHP